MREAEQKSPALGGAVSRVPAGYAFGLFQLRAIRNWGKIINGTDGEQVFSRRY